MDNNSSFHIQWDLWIKWITATALGFIINDGTQIFIPNQTNFSVLYILFIEGLVVAFFQWLFVLHSLTLNAYRWMVYSMVGYGIGWQLGHNFATTLGMALFIHGLILGIVQWDYLRKLYSKSFFWILANAIALPFAYILSWNVIFPLIFGNSDSALLGILDSTTRAVLFSSITGATLMWLSRFPRTKVDSSVSDVQSSHPG